MRSHSLVSEQTSESEVTKSQKLDAILLACLHELAGMDSNDKTAIQESITAILLRSMIPMSGMTLQQPVKASKDVLAELNKIVGKEDTYSNGQELFAYQFAREATSAGILPVYKDSNNEDLYVALICNRRNLEMYNWSAGYAEAPYPKWTGKLLSNLTNEIYFDRNKIISSAKQSMFTQWNAVQGDLAEVKYDWELFKNEFEKQGVVLPAIDIDSMHTAMRECKEEINLDISQFPGRKIFTISKHNTLGISQGDAPGQLGNKSTEEMVFLGTLDHPPAVEAGDDVAIVDWIKVSDISRINRFKYITNNKELCVFMLPGLELGLKLLWNHLLEQASMYTSTITGETMPRFSNPKNLVAGIEEFCKEHNLADNVSETKMAEFMKLLVKPQIDKTYTGPAAQRLLKGMLSMASYMVSNKCKAESFVTDVLQILTVLDESTNASAPARFFKPAPGKWESSDTSVKNDPSLTVSGLTNNS